MEATKHQATTQIQGGLGNKLFQIAHLLGYTDKYPNYEPFFNPKLIQPSAHDTTDGWKHFIRNIPIREYVPAELFEPANATGKYLIHYDFGQDITFNGYFQTEKYFEHIKDMIRERFRCPEDMKQVLSHKYKNLDSAYFIHFRRGDYVNNSYHYIDLSQYYARCLAKIPKKPGFVYVFSDDLEFARKFLVGYANKFEMCFVRENELNSLWLMSLCKLGGICANSSFSWWGAWLNENQTKKVYYPSRFYPHNYVDTSDLIPSEMTAIDV